MATPKKSEPKKSGSSDSAEFAASFVHWRSGKRIYAKDYGHRAFPIGKKKK